MVKRALFCVAMAFIVAMWVTPYTDGFLKLFSAGICATLFIAILILKKSRRFVSEKSLTNIILLVSASVLTAMMLSFIRTDVINETTISRYDGITAECSGRVEEAISSSSYYGTYRIKITYIDGEKSGLSVYLSIPDGELECGDMISGSFSFYRLSDDINGFDEERYCLSRGMLISAECNECTLDGYDNSWMLFQQLNRKLSGYIIATLGRDAGGLACALLLGNRQYIDQGVVFSFRTLGISHILALSGMHLTIISSIFLCILKRMKLSRKIRTILLGVIILLYMALTGFPLSVTRAGIMLIISFIGDLAGRRSDPLTSLAFSVAFILIIMPYSVYDIGLQLSFVCVFVIITLAPSFGFAHNFNRFKNPFTRLFLKIVIYAAELLCISVLTSLATLPIVSLYYGEISVVSPIANLLFVPLITLLIWMLTVFLPISLIFPKISVILRRMCILIINLSDKTGNLFGKTISLKYPFAAVIIAVLSVFLVLSMLKKKKVRTVALVGAAACAMLFAVLSTGYDLYRGGTVEISASYYNKSDELIVTDGSKCGVIDISNGSYSANRIAVNMMKEQCITEMDFYLLTHLHQRHIKTFGRLCDMVKINTLILPSPVSDTDLSVYESLIYVAERENIPIITYDRDGGYVLLSKNITFTYGEYNVPSRTTHPVVTFSLEIAGERYLYLGSSFEEGLYSNLTSVNAEGIIIGAHGPIRKELFELIGADADSIMLTSIEAGAYLYVPDAAPIVEKYVIYTRQ